MTTAGVLRCRSLVRAIAVVPVLASLLAVGAAAKVGPPTVAGCAVASTVHHAALVVEHGDGAAIRVCVAFSADSISGDQLLARSGLEYATAAYGSIGNAVCRLDNEPQQYPASCWTASSPYWAMYVSRGGGSWTFSSLGVSSQQFRDGDGEGFRYEGQSDYSVPPSAAGVCPPTVSPAPVPESTSHPAATAASTQAPHGVAAQRSPSSLPSTTSATSQAIPPLARPAPTSATAPGAVAAASSLPPSHPPAVTGGAWVAAGLGAVLLLLLVAQVARARRHSWRERSQP